LTLFTSVRTVWAKLDDVRYHRRQFPSGPWVRIRPLLRRGRVQTWWTRSPDQVLSRSRNQ